MTEKIGEQKKGDILKFKYRKSMKMSYRQQGYIFFRCQNLNLLTEEEQREIREICSSTGFGDAVFEYITTDATSLYICQRYYISEKWLAVKTAEAFKAMSAVL